MISKMDYMQMSIFYFLAMRANWQNARTLPGLDNLTAKIQGEALGRCFRAAEMMLFIIQEDLKKG